MPFDYKRNCILSQACNIAGSSSCNRTCPAFIALHGLSGSGGRVAASLVPREYALTTLDTSKAGEEQWKVYTQLVKIAETFDRQFEVDANTPPEKRIKSVYLWSKETGTGKTTTATALLNEWLIRHYIGSVKRGLQPAQMPAFFLDVNEWQTMYNAFSRPNVPREIAEENSAKYYRWMNAASTAGFAVLDDLGVRDASDAFRADLHTVINSRVSKQLPTVYTSNFPMEELERIYDRRLYDRVRDLTLQYGFTGESKRGKRK